MAAPSIVMLCFTAGCVLGASAKRSFEDLDRFKIFTPTAAYKRHQRDEFTRGFRRIPLLSSLDFTFFANEGNDSSKPLKINTPQVRYYHCFNQSSVFECHAPVAYVNHAFISGNGFPLNASLSSLVRHVICRRLLFLLMKLPDEKKEASIRTFDLHQMCPNPCRDSTRRPCFSKNAITDKCYRSDSLIFEDSFYCRCDEQMRWNPTLKQCVTDYKARDKTLKDASCNHQGTRRVEVTDYSYRCFCKTGFTGRRCHLLVHTCQSRIGGIFSEPRFLGQLKAGLSGRTACRIYGTGNQCKSYHPSPTVIHTFGIRPWLAYSCICQRPYLQDLSLPFPNCLARESKCHSLACEHGRCTAADSGEVSCSCDPGWFGALCNLEERKDAFLEWSPWSSCIPLCGAQRSRFRQRRCLISRCVEVSRQTRPCRPRACFRYFVVDGIMDAMKVRDKTTDVIDDLVFVFVWFFCSTIALATIYSALLLVAPFLDLVTSTQHVASFRTWWRAKKNQVIARINSLKRFRKTGEKKSSE